MLYKMLMLSIMAISSYSLADDCYYSTSKSKENSSYTFVEVEVSSNIRIVSHTEYGGHGSFYFRPANNSSDWVKIPFFKETDGKMSQIKQPRWIASEESYFIKNDMLYLGKNGYPSGLYVLDMKQPAKGFKSLIDESSDVYQLVPLGENYLVSISHPASADLKKILLLDQNGKRLSELVLPVSSDAQILQLSSSLFMLRLKDRLIIDEQKQISHKGSVLFTVENNNLSMPKPLPHLKGFFATELVASNNKEVVIKDYNDQYLRLNPKANDKDYDMERLYETP